MTRPMLLKPRRTRFQLYKGDPFVLNRLTVTGVRLTVGVIDNVSRRIQVKLIRTAPQV